MGMDFLIGAFQEGGKKKKKKKEPCMPSPRLCRSISYSMTASQFYSTLHMDRNLEVRSSHIWALPFFLGQLPTLQEHPVAVLQLDS